MTITNIPTAIMTDKEKRIREDRRSHSFQTLTYSGLSGRGRRMGARRTKGNYYLDYYSPKLFLMGFTLLLLSGLDAFFTSRLLQQNAYEANLLMAYLMSIDMNVFFAVKIGLTVFGTIALATHAHFYLFNTIKGKHLLGIMIGIYTLLICYEIVLLGK
ncbi:MAG: DUF5658 family protein [Gammaproteobacteria bacterium]